MESVTLGQIAGAISLISVFIAFIKLLKNAWDNNVTNKIKANAEKIEKLENKVIKVESQIYKLDIPEGIKLYSQEDGFIYLTEAQATELDLIDGAGWYVCNKWGEYIATGNDSWVLEINVPNTNGFYQYRLNNYLKNVQTNPDVFNLENGAYCNYSPKNKGTINSCIKEEFTISGTTGTIVVNSVLESVEEFKGWLQEINTLGKAFKLVYPLEKSEYTKITDKTFIRQLEALQKAYSYEGITNIDTYSTDEEEKAPLILSVEYLKSQKIINQKIDERITNLEALVLES